MSRELSTLDPCDRAPERDARAPRSPPLTGGDRWAAPPPTFFRDPIRGFVGTQLVGSRASPPARRPARPVLPRGRTRKRDRHVPCMNAGATSSDVAPSQRE